MFGLTEQDIAEILLVFKKFPNVTSKIIFGSRAKGNYRPGSDIDIAIKGQITQAQLLDIRRMLNEESNMPYHFDIVLFDEIDNPDMIDHITRVGQPL